MATQYANDIPFTASHAQQAFKLLELPSELLTLLESPNPPTLTITSTLPTASTPGHALLRHNEMKYQMRQKNTSNPLMILTPSRTKPTDQDDEGAFIERESITAIAKIEDTIELILQEETKVVPKVNKWHEKFASSRAEGKR